LRPSRDLLLAFVLAAASAARTPAQVTQRVSVASGGTPADRDSYDAAVSADGRFVAFESWATNLVPGDSNAVRDVFVRDRLTGTTERVSVSSSGVQGNFDSYGPAISADGRFVAFESDATNLVPGDTNGVTDTFVRDRLTGTTERASVDSLGQQGDGSSYDLAISADGRYVAFHSFATNLVAGDTNATSDVFVRDRQAATTERVSLDALGGESNSLSQDPSISADGRYVAFWSGATLVPADTNAWTDVYVRDRLLGTTQLVSVDSSGDVGDGYSYFPAISADGRYVAFWSGSTNLVSGDTNGFGDVFVHDRTTGETERASVDSLGSQGHGESGWVGIAISGDGRFVAFQSEAGDLVPGDANGRSDLFVRDRPSATTTLVSVDSRGIQANQNSYSCALSADGRFVAFWSFADDLVPGDTNASADVFLRDRLGGTSFTSACEPGVDGVIDCPCSNPPGGPGRGCDNSSATGGATLAAAGGTFLSSDSLVFTTAGEKPTALSVVMQGAIPVASGIVYGQGVRCTGGALKRLFTKNAIGGSITAPEFAAGDSTVSARSAAKGDPITAGQSRRYFVLYRDPLVLGGCPNASRFNATQTGVVVWSP
jgi:Tol biopolymer transport system component